jgi:hypothetical protein
MNHEYQIKLSPEDAHITNELGALLTYCGVTFKITPGAYTEVETMGWPVGLMIEQWLSLALGTMPRKQKQT